MRKTSDGDALVLAWVSSNLKNYLTAFVSRSFH